MTLRKYTIGSVLLILFLSFSPSLAVGTEATPGELLGKIDVILSRELQLLRGNPQAKYEQQSVGNNVALHESSRFARGILPRMPRLSMPRFHRSAAVLTGIRDVAREKYRYAKIVTHAENSPNKKRAIKVVGGLIAAPFAVAALAVGEVYVGVTTVGTTALKVTKPVRFYIDKYPRAYIGLKIAITVVVLVVCILMPGAAIPVAAGLAWQQFGFALFDGLLGTMNTVERLIALNENDFSKLPESERSKAKATCMAVELGRWAISITTSIASIMVALPDIGVVTDTIGGATQEVMSQISNTGLQESWFAGIEAEFWSEAVKAVAGEAVGYLVEKVQNCVEGLAGVDGGPDMVGIDVGNMCSKVTASYCVSLREQIKKASGPESLNEIPAQVKKWIYESHTESRQWKQLHRLEPSDILKAIKKDKNAQCACTSATDCECAQQLKMACTSELGKPKYAKFSCEEATETLEENGGQPATGGIETVPVDDAVPNADDGASTEDGLEDFHDEPVTRAASSQDVEGDSRSGASTEALPSSSSVEGGGAPIVAESEVPMDPVSGGPEQFIIAETEIRPTSDMQEQERERDATLVEKILSDYVTTETTPISSDVNGQLRSKLKNQREKSHENDYAEEVQDMLDEMRSLEKEIEAERIRQQLLAQASRTIQAGGTLGEQQEAAVLLLVRMQRGRSDSLQSTDIPTAERNEAIRQIRAGPSDEQLDQFEAEKEKFCCKYVKKFPHLVSNLLRGCMKYRCPEEPASETRRTSITLERLRNGGPSSGDDVPSSVDDV